MGQALHVFSGSRASARMTDALNQTQWCTWEGVSQGWEGSRAQWREDSAWAGLGGSTLCALGRERERKGIPGCGPGIFKGLKGTKSWDLWATAKGCLWLGHRVPGKKLAGDKNEKIEFGPNLAFSARKIGS